MRSPMSVLDLAALQQDLARLDMLKRKPAWVRSRLLEALLTRKEPIKLKMYQEPNHGRPHFHVDYGKVPHSASYALDTCQRIEGDLPTKYDRTISDWARSNSGTLQAAWSSLQSGGNGQPFIAQLPPLP
jgi:Domain of unknown function (DUF4160)